VARVAPLLLRLITGKAIAENHSHSHNDPHEHETHGKPTPEYDTDDVLKAARDYIRNRNEKWVNFSRVSQYLHMTFHDLKPKNLGRPNKKYRSLVQLIADHPSDFELRADSEKQGLYWIRLKPTR
jgi:hypothetical protein